MKNLVSILFMLGVIVFFCSCTLDRSELIKTDIPIECKLGLEMAYYQQKFQDKSSLVPISQACKEAMRYERCAKFIENRTFWEACNGALK